MHRRLAFALVLTVACSKGSERASDKVAPEPLSSSSSSSPSPLVLARGIRLQRAGAGPDVSALVRVARDGAVHDGRELLVYVGAKWCEPCRRFHDAALRGELDDVFPNLTLLEFDLDEDKERLAVARYTSDLIPLFAVPDADGKGSDLKLQGSVKGDGAVTNITPRLRALLERARAR